MLLARIFRLVQTHEVPVGSAPMSQHSLPEPAALPGRAAASLPRPKQALQALCRDKEGGSNFSADKLSATSLSTLIFICTYYTNIFTCCFISPGPSCNQHCCLGQAPIKVNKLGIFQRRVNEARGSDFLRSQRRPRCVYAGSSATCKYKGIVSQPLNIFL